MRIHQGAVMRGLLVLLAAGVLGGIAACARQEPTVRERVCSDPTGQVGGFPLSSASIAVDCALGSGLSPMSCNTLTWDYQLTDGTSASWSGTIQIAASLTPAYELIAGKTDLVISLSTAEGGVGSVPVFDLAVPREVYAVGSVPLGQGQQIPPCWETDRTCARLDGFVDSDRAPAGIVDGGSVLVEAAGTDAGEQVRLHTEGVVFAPPDFTNVQVCDDGRIHVVP